MVYSRNFGKYCLGDLVKSKLFLGKNNKYDCNVRHTYVRYLIKYTTKQNTQTTKITAMAVNDLERTHLEGTPNH